jgi:hypothetical protein
LRKSRALETLLSPHRISPAKCSSCCTGGVHQWIGLLMPQLSKPPFKGDMKNADKPNPEIRDKSRGSIQIRR